MSVIILVNDHNPHAVEAAARIRAHLEAQVMGCVARNVSQLPPLWQIDQEAPSEASLAVVLGGDGTLLKAAHLVRGSSTPILGVNFGNLGFLTNAPEGDVLSLVDQALDGMLPQEARSNLDITLEWGKGSHESLSCFALNELALTRGADGRIIRFQLSISGEPLAVMRGDGVVVASATGSTAYALSAGGPLAAPDFKGLIAVPIAPHTLRSRAVVTSPDDSVGVELDACEESREVAVLVDGEPFALPQRILRATVKRGEVPTTLLRALDAQEFYQD